VIDPEEKIGLEKPAILNSSDSDPINGFFGGSAGKAAGDNVDWNPLASEGSR